MPRTRRAALVHARTGLSATNPLGKPTWWGTFHAHLCAIPGVVDATLHTAATASESTHMVLTLQVVGGRTAALPLDLRTAIHTPYRQLVPVDTRRWVADELDAYTEAAKRRRLATPDTTGTPGTEL